MLRSPKLSGLMLVSKSWDLGGGPNFGKASASGMFGRRGGTGRNRGGCSSAALAAPCLPGRPKMAQIASKMAQLVKQNWCNLCLFCACREGPRWPKMLPRWPKMLLRWPRFECSSGGCLGWFRQFWRQLGAALAQHSDLSDFSVRLTSLTSLTILTCLGIAGMLLGLLLLCRC